MTKRIIQYHGKYQDTTVLPLDTSTVLFSVMMRFYQPIPSYFENPESVSINNLADK